MPLRKDAEWRYLRRSLEMFLPPHHFPVWFIDDGECDCRAATMVKPVRACF